MRHLTFDIKFVKCICIYNHANLLAGDYKTIHLNHNNMLKILLYILILGCFEHVKCLLGVATAAWVLQN